jgi:hypothetical protein
LRRRTIIAQQCSQPQGEANGAEEKREEQQTHHPVQDETVLMESAGTRPILRARWPRKTELKKK